MIYAIQKFMTYIRCARNHFVRSKVENHVHANQKRFEHFIIISFMCEDRIQA